ncbi:unknown [Prevotella sp. CAG:487]|nr:unknown [Prevotella sp. CAG:487]
MEAPILQKHIHLLVVLTEMDQLLTTIILVAILLILLKQE